MERRGSCDSVRRVIRPRNCDESDGKKKPHRTQKAYMNLLVEWGRSGVPRVVVEELNGQKSVPSHAARRGARNAFRNGNG